MCVDQKTPIQRFISTTVSGTASGAAKASPGAIVGGLSIAGYPIETWVSILTALYLLAMFIGCIPKVGEGIRYIYRWVRPKKSVQVQVTEVASDAVERKIEKANR